MNELQKDIEVPKEMNDRKHKKVAKMYLIFM